MTRTRKLLLGRYLMGLGIGVLLGYQIGWIIATHMWKPVAESCTEELEHGCQSSGENAG